MVKYSFGQLSQFDEPPERVRLRGMLTVHADVVGVRRLVVVPEALQ